MGDGSILGTLASMFGSRGDESEPSTNAGPSAAEVALEIRVPTDDNVVWSSFESLAVILRELRFEATDGTTETITSGVEIPLRDEELTDGNRIAWGMKVSPTSYETLRLTFEVSADSRAAGDPGLPIEGFEEAVVTLDDGGPFTPGAGEEWTLTLDVVVRENDAADAYVLDPGIEWRQTG